MFELQVEFRPSKFWNDCGWAREFADLGRGVKDEGPFVGGLVDFPFKKVSDLELPFEASVLQRKKSSSSSAPRLEDLS